MEGGGVGDVGDGGASYGDGGSETLAEEVGQVDGRVYAD